jgi:DNA invertase Pin-like site-specific DNA recombinase
MPAKRKDSERRPKRESPLQILRAEITLDALLHEWEFALRDLGIDLQETNTWKPALAQIRISRADTKYSGASDSPRRQLRRTAEYCAKHGFRPTSLCFEAQSGSLTDTHPRKLFEGFRRQVEAGDLSIDAVVTYNIDRFTRDRLIGEKWLSTLKSRGVDLHESDEDEPPRPLAKKESEYAAKFLRAWEESQKLSDRVNADRQEKKREGRLLTGVDYFGHTPIWEDVGNTRKQRGAVVNPAEAAWIREATARLATGEALNSIVVDFNERGYAGRQGGPCSHRSLRDLLVAPRMVAMQRLGKERELVPVPIEPILTNEEWARNCQLLEQRKKPPHRQHPLSGMLVCGGCGGRMVGSTRNRETRFYRCSVPQLRGTRRCSCPTGQGQCGCAGKAVAADGKRHVTRAAVPLEHLAVEIALAALDAQRVATSTELALDGAPIDDHRQQLERRLEELSNVRRILARQERDGVLTEAEATEELRRVLAQSEEVRQHLASLQSPTSNPVLALDHSELRRRLNEEGAPLKRLVVASIIKEIVLRSAPPGYPYDGIEVRFVDGYSVSAKVLKKMRDSLTKEYRRQQALAGRANTATREDEDAALSLWQQDKMLSEIVRTFNTLGRPTPGGGTRWTYDAVERAVQRAHERRGLKYEPRSNHRTRYSTESRNIVFELASEGRQWAAIVSDLDRMGVKTWDGKRWTKNSAQQCYRVECARRGTAPQGRQFLLPEAMRRRIAAMRWEESRSTTEIAAWLNQNGLFRRGGKPWDAQAVYHQVAPFKPRHGARRAS